MKTPETKALDEILAEVAATAPKLQAMRTHVLKELEVQTREARP